MTPFPDSHTAALPARVRAARVKPDDVFLAFETALPQPVLCLRRGGTTILRPLAPRQLAETLPLAIADIMREAGAGFAQLRLVAASTGPGSFIAVRGGVAAARALALARTINALGASLPQIFAYAANASHASHASYAAARPLCALVPVRNGFFYGALYRRAASPLPLGEDSFHCRAEDLPAQKAIKQAAAFACPPGISLSEVSLPFAAGRPVFAVKDCAASLAALAADVYASGQAPAKPAPVYLPPHTIAASITGGKTLEQAYAG